MATWSIYVEVMGTPCYAEAVFDDEMDEDEVWSWVYDDISTTLEVTKEKD